MAITKNKLHYENAKKSFNKIPIIDSPSEILERRISQLNNLLNHSFEGKSIHYEILRYYPLAYLALYEYYFKLVTYVMLKYLDMFSIEHIIKNKPDKNSLKSMA